LDSTSPEATKAWPQAPGLGKCAPGQAPASGMAPVAGRRTHSEQDPMSDINPVVRWFHQLGSPPYFDRFARRWAPWGYGLGLLAMGVGIYGALFMVPADYQQGDSF